MKKNIWVILTIILFILLVIGSVIFILVVKNMNKNNLENSKSPILENSDTTFPTEGNDTIITTGSKTTLRIINEYDKNFFTSKKNLLIMFGSWCEHCKEEIKDIEEIVKYYKNSKDIKVILIAHEYEDTVEDLKSMVENDVDFSDMEVFIDLKRIIRKTIDPEASTVPISYVVDNDGSILVKHDSAITLDKAKEMLNGI